MKTLTTLHRTTPPRITTPNNPRPQTTGPLHHIRRHPPFPPPRTWRLHGGAKGFAGSPRRAEPTAAGKNKSARNREKRNDDEDDDKIPDAVWRRMIPRILFYVGVPLVVGLALLQLLGVAVDEKMWDVPRWVTFLMTFVTFGASAMGVAIGSLSTSLDAEVEGSFLGFEQVEKNWVEMWKEEEDE